MAGNKKKNKNVIRYRRPFHLNIGLITFGIIFFYVMYYLYAYFTSTQVSAYEVIQGTIAINNTYTGLALRAEEVVAAEYSGSVNYYAREASKVGSGDLVCSVDEEGSVAEQINSANEDASTLDSESIGEIQSQISGYLAGYRPETFYSIYSFKEDLNAEISEDLSLGALNSISDTVTAAEGNATFHKGLAVRDGVVAYYTDGFEAVTAESFAADMFEEASYQKENLKEHSSVNVGEPLYKLITSEDWSLVIPITDETNRLLGDASSLRVRFKKDDTVLRASFTTEERGGQVYLILSMYNSMIRYATDRYLEVELLLDEETGLKIPNSAITTKDFFTVPMEYFQTGEESGAEEVTIRKKGKNGKTEDSSVAPDIYFATEYSYYVDDEELSAGDVIVKPGSDETYTIGETAKLEGIYNINRGYAVFKRIEVIYQNEEYSIIRSDTAYGISLYDHIALDGTSIAEDALIN